MRATRRRRVRRVDREDSFAGKTYFGNERTTFVIGADGRIEHVLPQVKPAAHVDQLLEALAA